MNDTAVLLNLCAIPIIIPSMIWRRWLHRFELLLLALLLICLLAPEWPAFDTESYQLNAIIGLRRFDFLVWEWNAFLVKGEAILAGDHAYLDAATRKQVVLDYLKLMGQARQLETQVNEIYAAPDVPDPDTASRELQRELARTRGKVTQVQPLAEAIVQDQVAAALVEQGFSLFGGAWPPVLMHVTPLPSVLVLSPRDHIESVHQVPLAHGLSIPGQVEMETAVFNTLDLSALVVPIGGLGAYPSMIMETANVSQLMEVTAHEWAHHWLTLHPVGLSYGFDPQMRIINETVASIVGQEIRDVVIARDYPEFVPPPPAAGPPSPGATVNPEAPPPFDFRAEMAETRVTADKLLAEGKIEAAEAYMEARRRYFVDNGYAIRKLNQAYFAFYGAYAAEPGATGADPIGPMLREIRAHSPSLHTFLKAMSPITSFADLEELYHAMTDPG